MEEVKNVYVFDAYDNGVERAFTTYNAARAYQFDQMIDYFKVSVEAYASGKLNIAYLDSMMSNMKDSIKEYVDGHDYVEGVGTIYCVPLQ